VAAVVFDQSLGMFGVVLLETCGERVGELLVVATGHYALFER
jgi:hypothetical protein